MTWWIPLIFVAGSILSTLALGTTIYWAPRGNWPWGTLVFLGFFTLFFTWGVWNAYTWPYFIKPRVVPYFERELERYGGSTSGVFWRGRALFANFALLERLAETAGVKPLSAYGFTDDYYLQPVVWHSTAEGCATVEALRHGLSAPNPDLAADLDVLSATLRVAQEQGVRFCLVLRLDSSDSLQAVCTREERSGRFW